MQQNQRQGGRGHNAMTTTNTDTPHLARKYISEFEPFTLAHFREWSSDVFLDNDEPCSLEPFQELFVEDLFSGRSVCWLCVPEGNGKTTLLALVALYWMEFKPGCKVLAAAAAVDQANLMYQQAEGMVLRTVKLHEMSVSSVLVAKGKKTTGRPRYECLEGWRRINHVNGSRFQVKPASDITGDGVIPDLCLIDELHRHRNLRLYRTWAGKLRKKRAKMIVISTAGEPGSEFEVTREDMRKTATERDYGDCFVRAASDKWILHDYAVPGDGDVNDLELVVRANPLSTVTVETLRETRELPGMTLQHFSRMNANVPARGTSAAIPERVWHDAATAEQIPDGADVWLGLDAAFYWDTTALVPLWWKSNEQRILGPAVILEPPRNGEQLDVRSVKQAIVDLCAKFRVSTVVMDISNAQDIAAWMSDDLGLMVVDRAQSSKPQMEDYERFMAALRQGWLRHNGDAGLRRHALNAVAKLIPGSDGARFGRVSETRQGGNQDSRVIDALVAAAMVHSVAVETHMAPSVVLMPVAWA